MKRKILLTALIVIALISAFAISVFATDFGTLETIDGMPERSKLDTTSRVVLFDGTDYHTYPAYYIFLNEATSKMDFTNINTKTGKSYDKTKVVLLEFPEGQTSVGGMESATLLEYVKIPDSATTLRSFKGSPALETIEFSKQGNLITVNDQAFSDCTALTTGSLPEGVTSAGTNVFISIPLLKACGRSLYFMPDGILVYDSRGVVYVDYLDIKTRVSTTRFIEDYPPSDANIVDHTWRYANVNGGPDRRFNNNKEIPICRYGELSIDVKNEQLLYIMTSKEYAADNFEKAMNEFRRYVKIKRKNDVDDIIINKE